MNAKESPVGAPATLDVADQQGRCRRRAQAMMSRGAMKADFHRVNPAPEAISPERTSPAGPDGVLAASNTGSADLFAARKGY